MIRSMKNEVVVETAEDQSEKVKKRFSDPSMPSKHAIDHDYRSVSKSAILSLVFAIFALTVVAFAWIATELAMMAALFGFFGVLFGTLSLLAIYRNPDDLIGRLPARLGLAVSLVIFVGGFSYHAYTVATEVREGYQRTTFSDLKPDRNSSKPVPSKAEELDGQKVFLKGFVRPGVRKVGLNRFLMVGDFGDCCFGGNPAITDVVAINLPEGETTDYSFRVRRIHGVFRLNRSGRRVNEEGVPQVYYTIDADTIE